MRVSEKEAREGGGGGGGWFNGAWAAERSQGPKFRCYSEI